MAEPAGWQVRLNDGSLLTEVHPTRASAHRFIADVRRTMPPGRVDPRWFDPAIEPTEEHEDMAPLTIAATTIALTAEVNGGEPFAFGVITLPVSVTLDPGTGVASLTTTPLGAQLAAAFRHFADELDEPAPADLPLPEGAKVIRCTQCDTTLIGDPRFASLVHAEEGAHTFEQRLADASPTS